MQGTNNNTTLRQGFQQPVFRIEKTISNNSAEELKLSIFPNPFRYDFSVLFEKEPIENINITIYDKIGRLVKEIELKTSNKKFTSNIIKQ